ncbi:MAG: hypothetical protein ACYCX2_07620 [Christensenellales bacterium]
MLSTNDFQSISIPLLTMAVTIFGFIMSYIANKKKIESEFLKQKQQLGQSKLADVPFQLLRNIYDIRNNNEGAYNIDKYELIINTVFAFGSKEATKVAKELFQFILYANDKNLEKSFLNENKFSVYSAILVLISQIKYDITGVIISPFTFSQITGIDIYNSDKSKYKKSDYEFLLYSLWDRIEHNHLNVKFLDEIKKMLKKIEE